MDLLQKLMFHFSGKYQGLTKVKEMKGTNFARLFIALHTMATSLHPAINL